MKSYDYFGQRVPGFNLKGDYAIKTSIGSALSLISAVIVLIYAASKTSHIQSVTGQTISTYFTAEDTSRENKLNLNDRNFRIAFAFENFDTGKLVDDPHYVRWIFRITGYKDNEWYHHILPYHKCTEEDYAEFYPIRSAQKATLESIQEDADRGFFCFDWNDEEPLEIFGDTENNSDH